MTEKPTKPAKPARAVAERATARKPRTKMRKPDHREIAERAYFIHLEESASDDYGNWLRAERELSAA